MSIYISSSSLHLFLVLEGKREMLHYLPRDFNFHFISSLLFVLNLSATSSRSFLYSFDSYTSSSSSSLVQCIYFLISIGIKNTSFPSVYWKAAIKIAVNHDQFSFTHLPCLLPEFCCYFLSYLSSLFLKDSSFSATSCGWNMLASSLKSCSWHYSINSWS
jgi:hypothetical protein